MRMPSLPKIGWLGDVQDVQGFGRLEAVAREAELSRLRAIIS